MKKLLVLLLCLSCMVFASGCEKDDIKDEPRETQEEAVDTANVSSEPVEEENAADETAAEEEAEQSGASSEGAEIEMTQDELINMADEFNNTTDPERKEELRQELQKILEQVESNAAQ